MERVTVEVLGDVPIARRLMRVGDNASDLSRSWNLILDDLERDTQKQFATDGRTFGTPWAPLAASTVESKRRKGVANPTKILVETGAMRASFSGGPDHVRRVDGSSAEWGSSDPKVMFHHGRQRGGNLPRRPIVELDEARRRAIMRVLQEGIFRDAGGYVRSPGGQFASVFA